MAHHRERLLDLRDWIEAHVVQVQSRIERSECAVTDLIQAESQKHLSLLRRLKGQMEQLIEAIEADYA